MKIKRLIVGIGLFVVSCFGSKVEAAFPIISYVQITTGAVQQGGFSTQSGTVGRFTDTGLASGECVQTGPGGLLTTTGSGCGTGGGGGGGSSSLEVLAGAARSSPTVTIGFPSPQFQGSIIASSITVTLNPSSVTLQGNTNVALLNSTQTYTGKNTFANEVDVVNGKQLVFLNGLGGSGATIYNPYAPAINSLAITANGGGISLGSQIGNPFGASVDVLVRNRFAVAGSSADGGITYSGFAPATTVLQSILWKLPPRDGSAGQSMTTDGAGNLTFNTISGSGSSPLAFVSSNGATISSPTAIVVLDTMTLTGTFLSGATVQMSVKPDLTVSTLTVRGLAANIPAYIDSTGALNVRAVRLNTADVSGTLPVANGGTGQTIYTDGQLLIGNSSTGGLTPATLTAGAGITITNGNGSITVAGGGGGDDLGDHIATMTVTANYGITASTMVINQTLTSATKALSITSTGTANSIFVTDNGSPGSIQSLTGGAVNITVLDGTVKPNLVLVSSNTDAQLGAGILELWQVASQHNDPQLWIHADDHNSAGNIRIDSYAPNFEIVNKSTTSTEGPGWGKWEPFAMAYQSSRMQMGSSRCWNNTGFDNMFFAEPMFKGGGLRMQPFDSTGCEAGAGYVASSTTLPLVWVTLNNREVGLKGPLNPAASWNFMLPSTFANGGQVLYQATDSGNRNWEFTTGGVATYPLMFKGTSSAPIWDNTFTSSMTFTAGIQTSTTTLNSVTFTTLGAAAPNGSTQYCSDCAVTTPATCTANVLSSCICVGSGTGAFAKRINGVWYCN